MAQTSLAPTHLLHLVDAVSRPIIFGLLLRDRNMALGLRLSLMPNPHPSCHSHSLPKS